ncbi:MAG: hypothetical protein KDD12_14220, partial [Lewinella sp.]|nr:hypothetical protein [Lewinella sp.]
GTDTNRLMFRSLLISPAAALVASLLFLTCSPKSTWKYLRSEDLKAVPASYDQTADNGRINGQGRPLATGACNLYEAFEPDTNHLDHTPIRYIRINFHWMNSVDGAQNLKEDEARKFTLELYKALNYSMENNKKMWLPNGNNTPCLPIRIKYQLTPDPTRPGDDGIYFHYDDKLYFYVTRGRNRNLYSRDVIEKYGVQPDSVLNIFMMPHHPDSLKSETYSAYNTGVALTNAMKLAAKWFEIKNPWDFRGVLNHETGHIYGLSHTWAYNDGCDDTPQHPQDCYSRGQYPGCDTMTSNNVMDYNAQQLAFTPCQIGKIHQRMAALNARQRGLLAPTWCKLDETKTIVIRDTVAWLGAKDLEGNLVIENGGSLTIGCRVSVPPGGRISVHAGGTLILGEYAHLHNACGGRWKGIEVEQSGELSGVVLTGGDPRIEDTDNGLSSAIKK